MGTRTQGIYRYSPGKGTWEQLGPKGEFPDVFVRSLAIDAGGALWAGTYGGGVTLFEPPALRFVARDVVLDYRGTQIRSSKGWTYDDRVGVRSLEPFLYGRRVRKVQCDAEQKHFCLYFDGPEHVREVEEVGSHGTCQGVVLLDGLTGEILWSAGSLPHCPIRWNSDATWVAIRSEPQEIRVQNTRESTEKHAKLPEEIADYFFLERGDLILKCSDGASARWRLNEESSQPTYLGPGQTSCDPCPVMDLKRAKSQVTTAARHVKHWPLDTECFELVASEPGPIEVAKRKSRELGLPDGPAPPLTLLWFEIMLAGNSATEGGIAQVHVTSKNEEIIYRIDRLSSVAQPVQLCIPSSAGSSSKLVVQAPANSAVVLRNIRWLKPRTSGIRARFLDRLSQEEGGRGQALFTVASPVFYLCTADRVGTAYRPKQHPKRPALLFDGLLSRPAWKTTEGMLGWSAVLEFGETVLFEGVVASGSPGVLSDQIEGISLEAWDSGSSRWRWVKAAAGMPQFHRVVFQKCTTSRIRLACISRKATLSELVVLASRVTEDDHEE